MLPCGLPVTVTITAQAFWFEVTAVPKNGKAKEKRTSLLRALRAFCGAALFRVVFRRNLLNLVRRGYFHDGHGRFEFRFSFRHTLNLEAHERGR